MTEHTKGPWEAKDVNPDLWTRQVWTKEGRGSVMIATTGGIDKDANARLIASAPDLLAVCEELVLWWKAPDSYGGDLADLAAQAEQVITKAKGNATPQR